MDDERTLQITVRHDPEEGVYRASHDFDGAGELSTSVLLAIESVVTTEEESSSPALYEAVDPDALDSLFRPVDTGTDRASGQVSFSIRDHEVTISADGTIEIRPPDDDD